MTPDQLIQAKNNLLNGLADGSIKTIEFSTYKEYLKKIHGHCNLTESP